MSNLFYQTPLPSPRELLKLYRISALKDLSQNFLLKKNLVDKFVRNIGNLQDAEVCEVGPGPGGITKSIIRRNPSKVVLVEKDMRFKDMLKNLAKVSPVPVEAYYADVLNFDMSNVFSDSYANVWEDVPPKIFLAGNLPFGVATALIIRWLKDISLKRNAWNYGRVGMTLTFQHEVAERIVSPESTSARCRLSFMCQNWCKVTYKFKIPGECFVPAPKVDVGVVKFEPLIKPIVDADFNIVEKFLRVSFNCRRKIIEKNVMNLFPLELRENLTKEIFEMSGVSPNLRVFNLKNEDFRQLILSYIAICDRDKNLYKYDYRGPKFSKEFSWKMYEDEEEVKEEEEEEKEEEKEEEESYVSSQY